MCKFFDRATTFHYASLSNFRLFVFNCKIRSLYHGQSDFFWCMIISSLMRLSLHWATGQQLDEVIIVLGNWIVDIRRWMADNIRVGQVKPKCDHANFINFARGFCELRWSASGSFIDSVRNAWSDILCISTVTTLVTGASLRLVTIQSKICDQIF